MPANLQGLIHIQDVSDFPENRYYVGTVQRQLYDKIYAGTQVAYRLADYAISYRNGSLIYGLPGTGKTEFAKYVAYKLQIPYIYLNFSNLIESYLGKTAKNLQTVFQYCQNVPCVLMLDEIDCIGLERGHDTGADGELGRTTISLMQGLDPLAMLILKRLSCYIILPDIVYSLTVRKKALLQHIVMGMNSRMMPN